MKKMRRILVPIAAALAASCSVMVNGPRHSSQDPYDPPHPDPVPVERFTYRTSSTFPFEDNSNRWYYTEEGGNRVAIHVTDTISDDGIMYYRVSFMEERVDTTDDWFKRSGEGILFSPSLIGAYSLFLPAKIDSTRGSFTCASKAISYRYYDSLPVGNTVFKRVLSLRYPAPVLHGFDVIIFADSIGIVELSDLDGRWPVTYCIDSCTVFGASMKF